MTASAERSDFVRAFGREPEAYARAPGRVNLIGEHTDYNGGFVLPVAIPQATEVELARNDGPRVRVRSTAFPDVAEFTIGQERRAGSWADYVEGVTWVLQREGFALSGFDAYVASDVPLGSGLSSSASFEVAMLRALRLAFDLPIDDVTLAKLAQKAENDLVGAPVGIMDPMAVTLADPRTALFLDARSAVYEEVALPNELAIIVIDSGVKHANVGGGYGERRAECERAAALLGVKSLRELDLTNLSHIARLPPPLDRRARHVVTENARVLRAVAALQKNDLLEFGRLLDESHVSMRDDFEVSTPEIDRLVAIARHDPTVIGARLTGGGFGGSIIAAAERATAREAGLRITEAYRRETGREGRLLVPGE